MNGRPDRFVYVWALLIRSNHNVNLSQLDRVPPVQSKCVALHVEYAHHSDADPRHTRTILSSLVPSVEHKEAFEYSRQARTL